MEKLAKFRALGLSEQVLQALERKGFEEPTEIQEKVIPLLLKSEVDVVGQAQTGTGKTASFGLPLLERLKEGGRFVQALILVPTRELALQVSEEINSLKGHKRLQVVAIYGGQSIEQQLRRLREGVDIVVGTPGRIIDHIGRGSLKLKNVSYVVLDEADEMLNMGFIEDVEEILKHTGREKRMLLFGATMPDRILNLAKTYMRNYEVVNVHKSQLTTDLTEQIY
ncbi:MAG: DEAD/DEAH box helicase, partial [Candidatus Omnitrophica bacterium]|nr:DEAD/DEAH box helicase [Candidatus Omnitrophota bacterium]